VTRDVTKRGRALMWVAAALLVVAGLATWTLQATSHHATSDALTLVTASPFSAPSEQIGGCREALRDHGRDRDPQGTSDQEDDECVSGWHVLRQPDGAPRTAKDTGS